MYLSNIYIWYNTNMEFLINYISHIQLICGAILVVLILLQKNESGLGSAFGGSDSATGGHTRRGPEKLVFIITIIVAIAFIATSITTIIV